MCVYVCIVTGKATLEGLRVSFWSDGGCRDAGCPEAACEGSFTRCWNEYEIDGAVRR